MCTCSGVREAATACIEELHQQLGGVVMAKLEALHAKPAQLKQLQTRLGQLAISSDTVQDFPLFQAVTGEPSGRRPGSMTSRSDSSTQVSFPSILEPAQHEFREERLNVRGAARVDYNIRSSSSSMPEKH